MSLLTEKQEQAIETLHSEDGVELSVVANLPNTWFPSGFIENYLTKKKAMYRDMMPPGTELENIYHANEVIEALKEWRPGPEDQICQLQRLMKSVDYLRVTYY